MRLNFSKNQLQREFCKRLYSYDFYLNHAYITEITISNPAWLSNALVQCGFQSLLP